MPSVTLNNPPVGLFNDDPHRFPTRTKLHTTQKFPRFDLTRTDPHSLSTAGCASNSKEEITMPEEVQAWFVRGPGRSLRFPISNADVARHYKARGYEVTPLVDPLTHASLVDAAEDFRSVADKEGTPEFEAATVHLMAALERGKAALEELLG